MVLESNPEAASVFTPEGWLPLHQLCRYSHSLESIKIVYDAFPSAAEVKSPKGSTPLQLLKKYHPKSSDGQSKELVNHSSCASVPILAQLVDSLSVCDNISNEHLPIEASISVAIPIEYSSSMGLTTFDDICNLLSLHT